ncbi:MAG: hypothetical protein ACRD4Y_12305, partial [Candidatus Acidiferrales bacterium]
MLEPQKSHIRLHRRQTELKIDFSQALNRVVKQEPFLASLRHIVRRILFSPVFIVVLAFSIRMLLLF